ncbi:hypothetical protein [Clostridium thermobutyricum]|uniref:hypothetical protein n=1 Tax=Clostridium thermobutyricum TaxID=29372 RepID=UPI0029436D1A|nr:hypothetical protein [Clostridium thermobutyricum]
MHNILIKSLEYRGKEYDYKNYKFKNGINIVLGDNKHGKTTFTYLIMYAFGINVEAFTKGEKDIIEEIYNDTDNYVIMKVLINKKDYIFKRKIKENIISIINEIEIKVFPIDRNNGLFGKDQKTFSDWLLDVLDIDLIKVENIFSTEHYLNFNDLFRYSYYDQFTSKKQMISDFGVGRNMLKNSPQMKKFIFETLLSYSNRKYYYKLKEVKRLESQIRELKSTKNFKSNIYQQITNYLGVDLRQYNYDEIIEEINNLKIKKSKLLTIPDKSNEKKEYLIYLKKQLSKIQENLIDNRIKEKELNRELKNAKNLYKNEKEEIKLLEELITLPSMYKSESRVCPICGGQAKVEKGKCICGNDLKSDIYHFMYSKEDYTDILKSKVSSNKTTNSVIENLSQELSDLKDSILKEEQEENDKIKEIEGIISQYLNLDIEREIVSINNEICKLSNIGIKLKTVDDEYKSIIEINENIASSKNMLKEKKAELTKLENDKYNTLQEHIRNFEKILNAYLEDYYNAIGEEFDYRFILNQEYSPIPGKCINNEQKVVGKHIPHSGETEIKIYFYLTMLKYGIINSNIIYPKILIIDTIKDNGIDNKSLIRILEKIFEFEEFDCQIIMTCGYEEFEYFEDKYDDMIIEKIGDSKLLNKVDK